MKEFSVPILKSDKVFKVTVRYNTHDSRVDTFSNEKDAVDHAQFLTNKSDTRDYIESVEVSHIIRYVVAN